MRANSLRAGLLWIVGRPMGRAAVRNETTDEKQRFKGQVLHFPIQSLLRAPVASKSALLFANAILGAALGVIFWTVAARVYSVASVGFSAAVVSAATLVATFSNLGLGALVVRYLPTAGERGRALCIAATGIPAMASAVIVSVGMAFPVWPLAGDLLAGGVWGILLPSLLAVTMSGMFVQDSIFIARHQARQVLVRGVGSGITRLVLILPLAGGGAYGLLGVFLGGACVSVALGVKAWGVQSPARLIPHSALDTPHSDDQQPGKWHRAIRGSMARYAGTNYLSGLFAQAPHTPLPGIDSLPGIAHGSGGVCIRMDGWCSPAPTASFGCQRVDVQARARSLRRREKYPPRHEGLAGGHGCPVPGDWSRCSPLCKPLPAWHLRGNHFIFASPTRWNLALCLDQDALHVYGFER